MVAPAGELLSFTIENSIIFVLVFFGWKEVSFQKAGIPHSPFTCLEPRQFSDHHRPGKWSQEQELDDP